MDNIEKVVLTCRSMMRERSYIILDEELSTFQFILTALKPNGERVLLYVVPTKLNTELVTHLYNISDTSKHIIIVYDSDVTSTVKTIIDNVDKVIELFCIDELKYNVLEHVLVPKHIKIGFQPQNSKKYPILKKSDPVARFMGYKTGDIIKIIRRDESIYYRYVK